MQRFIFVLSFFLGGVIFSQTPENPWRLFLGVNSVDIFPAGGDQDD